MSDQNQLLKQQQEKIRFEELKSEKDFRAVNLSLEENNRFRELDRYKTKNVENDMELAMRMMELSTTGDVQLSADNITELNLNMDRKMSFLLLNDEKTTGDSKEMKRVKGGLGALEKLLREQETLSPDSLVQIERQYDHAIEMCRNYVNSKNPWFPTGKRRLARVRDTLARLESEKRCFSRGIELFNEGLIDENKVATPYDLLREEIRKDAEEYKEKEKNRKYQDELLKEYNMDAFLEGELQKDPGLPEEYRRDICLYRIRVSHYMLSSVKLDKERKVTAKSPEETNMPPMLKDIFICGDLEMKGREKGLCDEGDASRLFSLGVYQVKRDKTGKPIDKEEERKDAHNQALIKASEELFEAKSAANQSPDNADLQNVSKEKSKALFDLFTSKIEDMQKKVKWPTLSDLKKNPDLAVKIFFERNEDYAHIKYLAGTMDAVKKLCGADLEKEYKKTHPLFEHYVKYSATLITVLDDIIKLKTHINPADGMVIAGSAVVNLSKAKAENAPEEQIRTKEELLREEEETFNSNLDDFREMFKDEQILLMEKGQSLVNMGKNADTVMWKLQNDIVEKGIAKVAEYEKKGIKISQKDAELMLTMKGATDSILGPQYDEAVEKLVANGVFDKNNVKGAIARELTSLLTLPKLKADGTAFNEEEQKKQDWNKQWFDCWINKDQVKKKEMMQEGIKRVLDKKFPTPLELRKMDVKTMVEKDPFYYVELIQNVTGLDNLKLSEPEIFNEIVPPGSLYDQKLSMMINCASYIKLSLMKSHIAQTTTGWDFEPPSVFALLKNKENQQERQEQRISTFNEFETAYYSVEKQESTKLWQEENCPKEKVDKTISDYRKVNPAITKEAVLFSLGVKEAQKQLMTEFKEFGKRARALHIAESGYESRLFGAGYYAIKKNAKGEPVNAEEKRKAEHNKVYMAAWDRFLTAREKSASKDATPEDKAEAYIEEKKARKIIMKSCFEFVRDLSQVPLPNPEELKNPAVMIRFATDDPFLMQNLAMVGGGYDKLNELFKGNADKAPEIAEMEKKLPGYKEFNSMAATLCVGLQKFGVFERLYLRGSGSPKALQDDKSQAQDEANCKELYDQNIKDYKAAYDALNDKRQKAANKALGYGEEESGVVFEPYSLLKREKRDLYDQGMKYVLSQDKELFDLNAKLTQKAKDDKLSSARRATAMATGLVQLGAVTEEDAYNEVVNLNKVEGLGPADNMLKASKEEREPVVKSCEKVLDQYLKMDVDILVNFTLEDVMGPKFKDYRAWTYLQAEFVDGFFNNFYAKLVEQHPEECKYKKEDLEKIRCMIKTGTSFVLSMDLAKVLTEYYNDYPNEKLDLDLLQKTEPMEVMAEANKFRKEAGKYKNKPEKAKQLERKGRIYNQISALSFQLKTLRGNDETENRKKILGK